MDTNRLSILSNASEADIRTEPYPHLVIKNALDEEVFAELQSTLPDESLVLDGREKHDTWFDYPACKVITDERITPAWREFFRYHTSEQFFHELLCLFGAEIRRAHPDLEATMGHSLEKAKVGMRPGGRQNRLSEGDDVSMECQFYVNYTRTVRAVRGPHVDRPSELFAALLYFRQPEDKSEGGDLVISKAKNPSTYPNRSSIKVDQLPMELQGDKVETVNIAKYEANTLVLFINTPKSIHAVSTRTSTEVPRRHINFCCDLNFDLFNIQLPPRLALKNRLEHTPVLWRLANYI